MARARAGLSLGILYFFVVKELVLGSKKVVLRLASGRVCGGHEKILPRRIFHVVIVASPPLSDGK